MCWVASMLAASLAVPSASFARHEPPTGSGGDQKHRFSNELTGSTSTRKGLRLKLVTDLGNVRIHTEDAEQVSYRVRVEANSNDAQTKKFSVSMHTGADAVMLRGLAAKHDVEGQIWVTFDVTVPREYSIEVSTEAGNIQVDDITGRVNLSTAGGNINLGNVDGTARVETAGGHVTAHDISGDLMASTAGGHITSGRIGGTATLRTGGGHIRVASVGGVGRFETGGGNISVEKAGAELTTDTGGGQIEVGEASGSIRARTGGGGIRVARVAGPTQLETGGGSIYLTQVQSAVRASTGAGGITAWFGPDVKLTGNSQLESGEGDIVVYLPKEMPVTIDAQIALGDEHHFVADPAFPVKITYVGREGARAVRAEGNLNGGGVLLRLRTVAGNIRLVLSDTCMQLQKQAYKQQMEQLQQQLKAALAPKPEKPEKPGKPDKPDK